MPRRNGIRLFKGRVTRALQNLAEINRPHLLQHRLYAGLMLMVWILKREVRAFGGCLGMYRR
jgi:hypothetical protein